MKNNINIYVCTFYRFVSVKDKYNIKYLLDTHLKHKTIKGTILIAHEGINGSIASSMKEIEILLNLIKSVLHIRKLSYKVNKTNFIPFNRMKVRIKNEIVALKRSNVNVIKQNGKLIDPARWNDLILNKNILTIDVRNIFEISIGQFKNSFNPKLKSFREFPENIEKINLNKETNIAMYCTGGIRCEKASSYLTKIGYKNIFQLNGGILNYLSYTKKNKTKNLWEGDCFVFDQRVAVNKELEIGNYVQCYGCRRPITKKETKSKHYRKGVHCNYCFKERTSTQFQKSITRQKQIERATIKGEDHTFKKILQIEN